ncbi:MAG: prepilin-type N-terminal cleavage/methylation domain-containing protein [Candidatus Wallbacteria bacterium]|nr:prepilin-type N-terminal cleavage/methylation domain-containing protein [Candidatus Wallbacteria bacterium]
MRRAFTLIELMVSFGVSVMLLGSIWFFHFGGLDTWRRGQQKEILNELSNTALERMVRELRMAESVTAVKANGIEFQKYHVGSPAEEDAHAYTGEKPVLETIRYELVRGERNVRLERAVGLEKGQTVFVVEKCEPEIFTAWVLEERDLEKDDDVKMHPFDFTQQNGDEVKRIVLIGLTLKLAQQSDSLEIRTKVSLPSVYTRLMQPGWNTEKQ